jgi:DNA-binding NtrC family response regulator
MTRHGSILVIDDEEIMREILETLLVREGYQVRLATNGTQGLELARSMPFDAAIVDVMMPGIDGIATLEELRTIDEDLPVVMVTAFASIETAIAAMKRGALDYITKPFKNDEVLVVLRNALERRQLVTENRALRQNLQTRYHKFANIIGRSPRMRQVFDLIIQAAPSRSTVLVNGESGTGKELVARALHTNSPRADRHFVSVNSGNLPPDLLESNLFGHVKGPSPAPSTRRRACSRSPTRAASSSTRSATSRSKPSRSCCASSRSASSCAWAASRTSRSTSASSPPPTSTCAG